SPMRWASPARSAIVCSSWTMGASSRRALLSRSSAPRSPSALRGSSTKCSEASRPVVGCRLPAAGQRIVPTPVDQPVRQLQVLRRGAEDVDHVLSRDRAGLRRQTRADIGPGEDLVVDDDPMLEEDRATIDPDEPGVDVIAVSESEGLAEADRLRADDTAPPLGLEGLPYPAADHHVQTPDVHDREVH